MSYLILLRHGESRWNLVNKFTGWVDVPLSKKGIRQALLGAKQLQGVKLDVAFTSALERARETLMIVLSRQNYTGIFQHNQGRCSEWSCHPDKLEQGELPIYSSEALNERYYGKLQGMDKDQARQKFGQKKVFEWRRSFSAQPPGGESLSDTYQRVVPYYQQKIEPLVKRGKNVIVSAHGNSLRVIIKYLEGISDEKIPHLELPLGKPLIYKYIRGRLLKQQQRHSFTRPLCWKKC